MDKDLGKYISDDNLTVVQAMQKIDRGGKGILFVVDNENRLIGCVTDGDIRRWLIKTADLNGLVSEFMFMSPKSLKISDPQNVEEFMDRFCINAVPVVDLGNRIIDIKFRNIIKKNISSQKILKNVPVIIMAGGKGTRLYPYTKILPKPLIPIGDIPIIERVMNKFTEYGTQKFYITVNYKKGMIKSYFEDLNPSYEIEYVDEDIPLGTGGSLSLIDREFRVPIIVANCDSLIEADFADIYMQHQKSRNKMTVVASLKNIVIPYGVINVKEHGIIESVEEKPSLSYLINTGMYIIDPEIKEMVPQNKYYHMTNLIDDVMRAGMRVGIYPVSEDVFLDMGEFTEMKRMEEKLHISDM